VTPSRMKGPTPHQHIPEPLAASGSQRLVLVLNRVEGGAVTPAAGLWQLQASTDGFRHHKGVLSSPHPALWLSRGG
jgi:hypothetical protein